MMPSTAERRATRWSPRWTPLWRRTARAFFAFAIAHIDRAPATEEVDGSLFEKAGAMSMHLARNLGPDAVAAALFLEASRVLSAPLERTAGDVLEAARALLVEGALSPTWAWPAALEALEGLAERRGWALA